MIRRGSNRMRHYFVVSVVAALFFSAGAFAADGSFKGDVVAQWLDPDRSMKLTQDFGYIDPSGRPWEVPVGTIVDGASIPRIFWTLVGAPYSGKYRKAS